MVQIRLPVELVMLVLEQAYYDKKGFPDRPTLNTCALVCKDWSPLAQRLLLHHVEVPASARRDAFRAALFSLNDDRAHTLAASVRRASFRITSPSDEDDLVRLVGHCRHLYELVLRVSGVHAFRNATIQALGQSAITERTTPLRALVLHQCGVQSPILYQLLAVWPTIQFLRLGFELAAPAPQTIRTAAKLYELVLYRTPSLRAMSWILSASKRTLRILECHAMPSADYNEILDDYTEHLLSLRIRQSPRTAQFIRKCVSLRELVFIQLSTFLPLGELPQSIEHLAIRYIPGVSTEIPTSIISAVDKLPRLRLISCDVYSTEDPNYPALKEKCREKAVVLDHNVVPLAVRRSYSIDKVSAGPKCR